MLILAVLALVVAVVALVLALLALRRGGRRPGDGVDALPEDVQGLRQEVAALQREGSDSLRHVAVVRYDAFGDVGGRLSWSVALLDDGGDGVVLTSIAARTEVRAYAKTVTGWAGEQELSPQELEAIGQARPS